MTHAKKSILVCGLPDSGKTTFLGALSYLLKSREIETSLSHAGIADERRHMNRIAESWAECRPMERTRTMENGYVELHLSSSSETYAMHFPDLSGETWRNLWCSYECPEDLAKLIEESPATILFIHADKIRKPFSIVSTEPTRSSIAQEADTPVLDEVEWNDAQHSSTQAQVVSLLQLVKLIKGQGNKLAIVLSAWDKIPETETPISFLESGMPLLYQYLMSRVDYSIWEVFGVSAQGGDLTTDKDELLSLPNPSERIRIRSGFFSGSDLTEIIKWAVFS